MAEQLEIYKCPSCGIVVEVLEGSACQLACCDQEMKLFEANTIDSAKEKHVPVIEKISGGYKVKIGSVPHPMEEKHYVQ